METSTLTIIVKDRNEVKTLTAWGFTATPCPRNHQTLDFSFMATDSLFEARRAYSLNRPVPCLNFIQASQYVDSLIHDHRNRGAL